MIIHDHCPVVDRRTIGENIFVLTLRAPAIAAAARPGQFVNIKIDDACDPLLRRPFSIYRVDGATIEVLFNIVGKGTQALARKVAGDMLDVLGPLGMPFTLDDEFSSALLVSGGLGVAPMPFLSAALQQRGVAAHNFVGARTASLLAVDRLPDVHRATDDGSAGFHGSVVRCLEEALDANRYPSPKIFACGPNRMLLALADFARARGIVCEAALECAMACGIGICQGCPVEMSDGPRKYNLVCKDGPVFDVRRIKIESLIAR